MKRSEALRKLSALAEWTRSDPGWASSHPFPYVEHGANAVRAINCALDDAETHATSWPEVRETTRHAVREARAAFRCALRAVGLRGAL